MAITIGIDLGTSNSCAAAVIDGVPQIIRLPSGEEVLPSVFTIDKEGNRLIGQEANEANEELELIAATKRLIGRNFHSRAVDDMRQIFTYELMEGVDQNVLIKIKDQILTLEEISGAILEKIKQNASEVLGCPIKQAVITVPAYFNDRQRQAVKQAGVIAGLDIIRIINEPTAAALAYGFRKTLNKRVAVFDLGGGTFDISVIEIKENVFEVIASGGNPNLGGVDFDDRLMRYMLEAYFDDSGMDLSIDKLALREIREAAETAKIKLSTVERVQVHLNELKTEQYGVISFKLDLSRELLESLTSDLVDSAIASFQKILMEAGTSIKDLEEVLLVGGQSRMPMVKQKLNGLLGYEPAHKVHPDQAVALGAAMMAHALTDQAPDKIKLLDVLPMSIGLPRGDGKMQILFPKNIPLPCERTRQIRTFKHNQNSMMIRLYQGEEELIENNEHLCTYVFKGLRPTLKAKLTLAVSFLIDVNGMLHISARDKATGVPVETLSNVRFNPDTDGEDKDRESYQHSKTQRDPEKPFKQENKSPILSETGPNQNVTLNTTLSDLITGIAPLDEISLDEALPPTEEKTPLKAQEEAQNDDPDLPDFFPNLKEVPEPKEEGNLLSRPLSDLETNFESHDFEDMDAELPTLSSYQQRGEGDSTVFVNESELVPETEESSTKTSPQPIAPPEIPSFKNDETPIDQENTEAIKNNKDESSAEDSTSALEDIDDDSMSQKTEQVLHRENKSHEETEEESNEEKPNEEEPNEEEPNEEEPNEEEPNEEESLEDSSSEDHVVEKPQDKPPDNFIDTVLNRNADEIEASLTMPTNEVNTNDSAEIPIEIPRMSNSTLSQEGREIQRSREIELGFFGDEDSDEDFAGDIVKPKPRKGLIKRFFAWLFGKSRD